MLRQSNTTFVNLRAALDDLEPLVEHGEAGDQGTWRPFLAELRPGLPETRAVHPQPAPGRRTGPARPTTPPTCWRRCRRSQELASNAFPHSEEAIAAFQPNLNFIRAYTPDLFNAIGKLGQVAGYYDGNGHYVRASTSAPEPLPLQQPAAPNWNRSRKAQQFEPFGSIRTRTAAAPAAPPSPPPTAPTPWVGGGSVNSSECNPADVPPGP